MSDSVSIMKKSTAKKIVAIALCVIILLVAVWFFYQPTYEAEKATLLADQWQVEKDLTNVSHAVALLKAEVNQLQSQLNNLQDTLNTLLEQNNTVVELNLEYSNLKFQVLQANQTVLDLEGQLAEAQATIEELLKIQPTPDS